VVDYDAELRLYNDVLRDAGDVLPEDHVLDIGCGGGLTSRQAARDAGSVLGVDVSEAAVERARESAEGLDNVEFVCADAQTHDFGDRRFDLAISRFGTMFFADPAAAFTNVGRALRPGGRLVMMVWQAKADNEWAVATGQGSAAFSLADPVAVTTLLHRAGFVEVTFTDVRRPVYYGPDPEAALDFVRGFASTAAALDGLDPAAAEQVLDRLRATMAEHRTADGVWFDSTAWIVSAVRSR
jgi:SAM-dependent methyltransferase